MGFGASREKLSEALLRGESGRRDPFSWTSLLVVPLSPPPHHAHSTERIASPAHPLRSYPAAVAAVVAALAPAAAASSPEDREGSSRFGITVRAQTSTRPRAVHARSVRC